MGAEQWSVEHANGSIMWNALRGQRVSDEQTPAMNKSAASQPAGASQSSADAPAARGASALGWWNMRTCLGVPISIGG